MADGFHPIQTHRPPALLPASVTERCYEVYSHLYGTSQSLARLNERCGFGLGEVIAFLYAHTFPKAEWSARVDEALKSPPRGEPA